MHPLIAFELVRIVFGFLYICLDRLLLLEYDVLLQVWWDRTQQVLALEPLAREQPALITICAVAQHRHDRLACKYVVSN